MNTRRVLVAALVAMPILLLASYVWRNTDHGVGLVLGTIGWLGFLLAVLVVIGCAVVLMVGRLRHRRA